MRALVISDTHFGAWTGEPLLQHEWARRKIGDALEDVDELVLLGDLFDFLFSSVENAFAQAHGFFSLLGKKIAGKRIVFSCGNHDHHIVVRDLRTAVELNVITGNELALAEALAMQRNFFQRLLDRRLPGVESVIAYPTHQVGDVLCCHGHYLDAHMRGSLADRLLTGAVWRVAGGRPSDALTIEDYERSSSFSPSSRGRRGESCYAFARAFRCDQERLSPTTTWRVRSASSTLVERAAGVRSGRTQSRLRQTRDEDDLQPHPSAAWTELSTSVRGAPLLEHRLIEQ